MTRIVIDPITRIGGLLRIEAEIENGVVTDAWSSATMFRGLELTLAGRDPRDSWLLAQRICGSDTGVHALASVRTVEDALKIMKDNDIRRLVVVKGKKVLGLVTERRLLLANFAQKN